MAALTGSRNTKELGSLSVITLLTVPVEAGAYLHQGGLVGIDGNGYAVPATPGVAGAATNPLRILGRVDIDYDNTGTGFGVSATGGTAGAAVAQIRRGTFAWDNGVGVDAISQANVGQVAYAIDDHTVALTPGLVSGAAAASRLPVGRIVLVDANGVWVETGIFNAEPAGSGVLDIVVPAGGALAYGTLVKVNATGQLVACVAGDPALGALVNAPAALNAAGIVRISGPHPGVKAGGTIPIGSFFESNATGLAVPITATSVAGAAVTAGERLGIALTAGVNGSPFAAFISPRGIPATTQA